jgi:hypothetical protein
MSNGRSERIPLSGLVCVTMGFLPTAICLGVGIWLVVAGRAVFGAALIAAAVVIEFVLGIGGEASGDGRTHLGSCRHRAPALGDVP